MRDFSRHLEHKTWSSLEKPCLKTQVSVIINILCSIWCHRCCLCHPEVCEKYKSRKSGVREQEFQLLRLEPEKEESQRRQQRSNHRCERNLRESYIVETERQRVILRSCTGWKLYLTFKQNFDSEDQETPQHGRLLKRVKHGEEKQWIKKQEMGKQKRHVK